MGGRCRDAEVFGGSGWSIVKLQLQVKEARAKLVEGVLFGARGIRLLSSDVATSIRLFWRAVIGEKQPLAAACMFLAVVNTRTKLDSISDLLRICIRDGFVLGVPVL